MNVVIAAGGTGGHLYPAVSLAQEFFRQRAAASVLFVGTSRGLERKVLAHEGLELETIEAQPVMGGGLTKALSGIAALPRAVHQAMGILKRQGANLVMGIGGYTSPPVILAAALLRIPRVILEPNARPGVANRVVGPVVNLVFLGFDSAAGYFSRAKVRVVGTPIRRAFFENIDTREKARGASAEEAGRKTLLIFGGSQGAQAINRAVVDALPYLRTLNRPIALIHQTGEADHAGIKQAYKAAGVQAEVVPFLFDMPAALRSSDLVVSRAGAVTVAELTACGKPAILIPLPRAIHAHQLRNAEVLEAAGAAVILEQRRLTGAALADTVGRVLGDENRLRDMGRKSRALGRIDAADRIVQACHELVGNWS
jgi:UDP-N-acetylglucosamine--N-acetylmuramyl-(pentapeptide) pyrophosphoryl-undecaprenol N-acetylglucosamine transferase